MTNGLITPDYKPHETLREQVEEFLRSCGYEIYSWGYESLLPEQGKRLLQGKWNPTGLHLRGHADALAIHQSEDIVFEVEFKTHYSTRLNDMLIEALPLVHHWRASFLGVKCLYSYWNPNTHLHAGFWAGRPPKMDCVMLPDKLSRETTAWFEQVFSLCDLTAKVRQQPVGIVCGSGDPYVKISEEDARNLPSWKDLILALGPRPSLETYEQLDPYEIENSYCPF